MNPEERYELKKELAFELWEEYSELLDKLMADAKKAEKPDAEERIAIHARDIAGGRPDTDRRKWNDGDGDWFQQIFVHTVDIILERYSVTAKQGSCAEWQAEKLGREMWKIFDDKLEQKLHSNQKPRPTPSWRPDRFQSIWVSLVKWLMSKYELHKK